MKKREHFLTSLLLLNFFVLAIYLSLFTDLRCYVFDAYIICAYILYTLLTHGSSNQNKQTPLPLVHKRTVPTERPSLVDEI
jgi:hypothetical protein